MPELHEIKQAIAKIHLARYLMTKADQRGKTHGEKHYIVQTALMLLTEAQSDLGDSQARTFSNEVSYIEEPSDIPF